jgi:heme/copper-type cytochrome/quinol oxidase subunit 2
VTSRLRWILIAGGLAAVVGLFVLLRPGGGQAPPAASPPATTPSPQTATPPTVAATSPEPSPSPSPTGFRGTVVEISFRNGGVSGPNRVRVRQGDRVRIVVESDVADEVHVHGFDLMADVEPGSPARIEFRATATGVFEIELESRAILLFRLEVSP